MRQGIQTNFKHEELRKYGCYFFSICRWAEIFLKKEFTDDFIIKKFYEYHSKYWIGNNCWIREGAKIFNDLIGDNNYFSTIEITDNIPTTKRFPAFIEGAIPHFVLCEVINGKIVIIFDSWEPSAESRGLKITNYRHYK